MPEASKTTGTAGAARVILVVTALLLPTLSLVPLGGLYLWEKGYLLPWAVLALLVSGSVGLLERWVLARAGARRNQQPAATSDDPSRLDPTWNSREAQAWADVRGVASRIDLERLTSLDQMLQLGHHTINVVARRIHPERHDAILQFTMPEALAITERVSRRLGTYVDTNIPFADKLTIAHIVAMYGWRHLIGFADQAYALWRIVRLVNPATAVTHEARERLSRAFLNWGREHVTRRIAVAYVEEVGRAAIDLYGGRLTISRDTLDEPEGFLLEKLERLENAVLAPLSVLVIGGDAALREMIATGLDDIHRKPTLDSDRPAGAEPAPAPIFPQIKVSAALVEDERVDTARLHTDLEGVDAIVLMGNELTPNGALAAIDSLNTYYRRRADLLPAVLVFVATAESSSGQSAPANGPNLQNVVDRSYAGPVVACDGASPQHIWHALGAAAPLVIRVQFARLVQQSKSRPGWLATGRKTVNSLGARAWSKLWR